MPIALHIYWDASLLFRGGIAAPKTRAEKRVAKDVRRRSYAGTSEGALASVQRIDALEISIEC